MNPDEALVNQIVQDVLKQLGTPAATARPAPATAPAGRISNPSEHVGQAWNPPLQAPADSQPAPRNPPYADLSDPVITAVLLEQSLNGAGRVRIAPRAILTPSARDFLRARNIECIREDNPPGAKPDGARWMALVVQAAPAVLSALDDAAGTDSVRWTRDLPGSAAEAARAAVAALCRAEADGVIVFAEDAEAVACRANRNPRVRAAVVAEVQRVETLRRRMGANLVCIPPQGKSYFELRNLLRAFTAYGPPQAPLDWKE